MREDAKRDAKTRTSPSSVRAECERLFERYFGRAWDTSSREQILAAVRTRNEGFLLLREINRVAVGAAALKRMLDGVPPPEEELPPPFPSDRKHDDRYLLVWAIEEGLVPFVSGPVSPRALAVISLLMGYEHDSLQNGIIKSAETRMKKTRQRYRQERPPTTPETIQRVAKAGELRVLEAPLRQALDALMQMFEATIHPTESVPVVTPVGTVSQG